MAKPYIFKFGGSSLKTATCIAGVVDIIAGFEKPLAVVTSALAGITDLLVEAGDERGRVAEIRDTIQQRHLETGRELGLRSETLNDFEAYLDTTLDDLAAAATGNGRTRDLVLSIGERLSTNLLAAALEARGIGSRYVDSRPVIRTDSHWSEARIDLSATHRQITETLAPILDEGDIPVVTGFLGSNEAGETTTIGRNGSDLTATLLGRCLDANEVWIWTDVDGIYTADPRYHEGAKVLPEISFREAAEAAYFGATVIHPHTLWPVLETEVAVRIKNTFKPQNGGTLICAEPKQRGKILITTSVEGVAVITVGGYGMVGVPGVAATIFTAVKETGTNVLMISQSSAEHNITFVIRDQEVHETVASLERALSEWIEKDHLIDRIRVVTDVAVITVVGENMRGRYGIAGKIFSALGRSRINVIAIAQGSSEYSISMVLKEADMRRAIDAIHGELDEENHGN
ncbi:MAG: aspartate kinase [Fidelibacterota bacterium]|nr:MAG: aspartate kinase [Candidatus Neomarinimicrobiota bacterium]